MFTEELRREVAASVRDHQAIVAMRLIVTNSPLELRDAKAIALHITREPGVCHRCSYPLVRRSYRPLSILPGGQL